MSSRTPPSQITRKTSSAPPAIITAAAIKIELIGSLNQNSGVEELEKVVIQN